MNSFENTEVAFSDKSDKELSRAYRLFKLVGNPGMVKLGKVSLNLAMFLHLPIKEIIRSTVFGHFCGGETVKDSLPTIEKLGNSGILTLLDYSAEGKESKEDFNNSANEVAKTIHLASENAQMPFSVFKPTGLIRFGLMAKLNAKGKLNKAEESEWGRAKSRVRKICELGAEKGVAIFIDAEESWIQDAIDQLVEEMMESFNTEKVVVYNTLQLYRKDRLEYLKSSYDRAKAKGYKLGVKLVRGAYLDQERDRAADQGYPSPIQNSKEDTDRDYDMAVKFCVDNHPNIQLIAGTHNEQSSKYLVDLMAEKGLKPDDPVIYFSQLFGMSDNISYNLAAAGFNVVKYVPYGPINEVMPYLIRRAEENRSIAGQTGRELALIMKEKTRRRSL